MIKFNIASDVSAMREKAAAAIKAADSCVKGGMQDAKEPVRERLKAEFKASFNVKDSRAERTWRIAVRKDPPRISIENALKGFELHAWGGTISPRGGQALLIPINTRGGTRLGTKKFYKMIDWLMQNKLTVILGNILYVKPVMNTSRRGGVAVGTRINKKFRQRFQGPKKRPSGFDIILNPNGLTPIAVLRHSITLRKRIDMDSITRSKLVPIVLSRIKERFDRLK